jgi:glycosyltransferase involved in cell wall biosynthesis
LIADGVSAEAVAPGDAALLSDALVRLILDKSRRERLGDAARQAAILNFSLPRLATELKILYNRVGRNTS